ncbi:MAG: hypothetical protein R2752_05360 [Vicinamibacterales bacterium]
MPHVIERAPTGRAKCRGCGTAIARGDLRLGEQLPNPFADDEGALMTHWFHLACGAYRRPEAFLEALSLIDAPDAADPPPGPIEDRERLAHEAAEGVAHHRLPRVNTAERAATGRATCRACKTPIPKDAWRISLLYYEDGRFTPSGFIHAACAPAYLETTAILPRVRHFTPALTDADAAELEAEFERG